jgi:hypothetical protein
VKLQRLFIIEIAVIIVAVVAILIFVQVSPFLASSKPDSSVDVFDQKEFASGNATLTTGQRVGASFNYSTYDPAILVLDLAFQSWQQPGNLSIYCNTKRLTTIYASQEKPQVTFNIISLSGLDWVDAPTLPGKGAVNRISFASEVENGYEGSFSYELYVRGSR